MTFHVVEAIETDSAFLNNANEAAEALAGSVGSELSRQGLEDSLNHRVVLDTAHWDIEELAEFVSQHEESPLWVALEVKDEDGAQTVGLSSELDLWEALEALDEAGTQRLLVSFSQGSVDVELLREISAATQAQITVAGDFGSAEDIAAFAAYSVEGIDSVLLNTGLADARRGMPVTFSVADAEAVVENTAQAEDAAPFDGTEISGGES